jgi:hypothetical protein
VLDEIDRIESQVAYIQIELEEKGEVLGQLMGAEQNKSNLVHKLEEIESKVSQNDRDMSQMLERSEA